MVRAHWNASEYNPMLAVMILFLGSRQPASWVEWTFIGAAVSRVLPAAGRVMSPPLAAPGGVGRVDVHRRGRLARAPGGGHDHVPDPREAAAAPCRRCRRHHPL